MSAGTAVSKQTCSIVAFSAPWASATSRLIVFWASSAPASAVKPRGVPLYDAHGTQPVPTPLIRLNGARGPLERLTG